LVSAKVIEVESGASEGVFDVVDDRALDRFLIASDVGAHQFPKLLAFLVLLSHPLKVLN